MTKEARVINSEMPQRGVLRRIFQVTHDGAEEKRWPLSSTLSPLVPRGEREKLQSPSTRGLRRCRRPAAAAPKRQRLDPSRLPALSYPLRLVFDTAAVRIFFVWLMAVERCGPALFPARQRLAVSYIVPLCVSRSIRGALIRLPTVTWMLSSAPPSFSIALSSPWQRMRAKILCSIWKSGSNWCETPFGTFQMSRLTHLIVSSSNTSKNAAPRRSFADCGLSRTLNLNFSSL